MRIDSKGLHYKELNEKVYQAISNNEKDIILDNVNGQRYIGAGIKADCKITINGVPGNDLSLFMDGLTIEVNSNAQDGIGNTMNSGKIIVHGNAGDIAGLAMRGGKIYIKGNAGYRVGIHMKSYKELYPVIIIGGDAGDFLGEYMAGGLIILLGKAGNYIGTGMHGGTIFIKNSVEEYQLGKEVKIFGLTEEDKKILKKYLTEYAGIFGLDLETRGFTKLVPYTSRPYGRLYAY